ncbi:succinate--CoA ligase subunit alpha [archaeon]|jgi:succinyl-CoA synthetase alpha subunit|nr:succinate--CoA ligase subunit alpha [archaeon]MBT4397818.1 succinate--CoA ligase subunit alpha [archaeon]MBT4441152.1 succinate--CoA ligase subunit alpha [archaeon]
MSIAINTTTKVIVQGLGKQGLFHLERMLEYGTKVVAGVNPNLKETKVPVYKTVKESMEHKPEWSVIFVPAKFAKDACIEALNNNLNICIITEGIPVKDMIEVMKHKGDNKIIGPNCPGVCSVGESKLGIMPNHLFKQGKVGVVSRSGTLTYEIVDILTKNNIGQSTVVGIGGDMIIGSNFIDILDEFEKDENTTHIVLLGEIGGDAEERAAEYIKNNISKPVIAYIAGKSAPKGKRMGHAGAVVYGNKGTASSKIETLRNNGIKVVDLPSEIIKNI